MIENSPDRENYVVEFKTEENSVTGGDTIPITLSVPKGTSEKVISQKAEEMARQKIREYETEYGDKIPKEYLDAQTFPTMGSKFAPLEEPTEQKALTQQYKLPMSALPFKDQVGRIRDKYAIGRERTSIIDPIYGKQFGQKSSWQERFDIATLAGGKAFKGVKEKPPLDSDIAYNPLSKVMALAYAAPAAHDAVSRALEDSKDVPFAKLIGNTFKNFVENMTTASSQRGPSQPLPNLSYDPSDLVPQSGETLINYAQRFERKYPWSKLLMDGVIEYQGAKYGGRLGIGSKGKGIGKLLGRTRQLVGAALGTGSTLHAFQEVGWQEKNTMQKALAATFEVATPLALGALGKGRKFIMQGALGAKAKQALQDWKIGQKIQEIFEGLPFGKRPSAKLYKSLERSGSKIIPTENTFASTRGKLEWILGDKIKGGVKTPFSEAADTGIPELKTIQSLALRIYNTIVPKEKAVGEIVRSGTKKQVSRTGTVWTPSTKPPITVTEPQPINIYDLTSNIQMLGGLIGSSNQAKLLGASKGIFHLLHNDLDDILISKVARKAGVSDIIRTEEGDRFYRMADGSVVDNLDPSKVSLRYSSVNDLVEDTDYVIKNIEGKDSFYHPVKGDAPKAIGTFKEAQKLRKQEYAMDEFNQIIERRRKYVQGELDPKVDDPIKIVNKIRGLTTKGHPDYSANFVEGMRSSGNLKVWNSLVDEIIAFAPYEGGGGLQIRSRMANLMEKALRPVVGVLLGSAIAGPVGGAVGAMLGARGPEYLLRFAKTERGRKFIAWAVRDNMMDIPKFAGAGGAIGSYLGKDVPYSEEPDVIASKIPSLVRPTLLTLDQYWRKYRKSLTKSERKKLPFSIDKVVN